jgi:hypothetical protein
MGWELHITRKEWWADPKGPQISFDEWQAYLVTDPEVKKGPNNSKDDFLIIQNEGEWPLWYNPRLGELHTKNPSKNIINKLKEIATRLDARVLDDNDTVH